MHAGRPVGASGKTVLIVNPAAAAGGVGRRWPAIAELARSASLDFDAVLTTRPGDATEIARRAVRESRPLVVAVGGDGTLNEVVNGFFEGAQANCHLKHVGNCSKSELGATHGALWGSRSR